VNPQATRLIYPVLTLMSYRPNHCHAFNFVYVG
jgi:hypothetical protein